MDDYLLLRELLFNSSVFIALILLIETTFKRKKTKNIENILLIFIVCIYILLIGNRPIIESTDAYRYVYNFVYNLNTLEEVLNYPKDKSFYLYSYFLKQFIETEAGYLTILVFTFILPYYILIKKLDLRNPFIFFILLTCSFSFSNLGSNIIRQGFGTSFFLLAIVCNYKNENKQSLIYFIISILCHSSLALAVLAYIACKYIYNKYFYLLYYISATILSILNIKIISFLGSIPFIGGIFLERSSNYENVINDYKVGFRIDFYLYNTFFLILFLYIYKKYKFKDEVIKTFYGRLIRTYILLSGYFYLMFTQSFSDRYGVLSWVMIPLFFIPFYQKDEFKLKWINSLTIFLIYVFISYIFKFK